MLLTITKTSNPKIRLAVRPRVNGQALLLSAAIFLAVTSLGDVHAQTAAKPCEATAQHPCSPSAEKPPPSTAEQFPFPGSPDPVKVPDAPSQEKSSQTPATPTPAKPASSAEQFPFPGEAEPAAPATPDASSSSSSSSSSSPSSGSADAPEPDAAPAETDPAKMTRTQRRHLPKVEDLDAREAKDIEVSRYYFSTGDFRAAYLRAKDAVKIIPDDPEAHFALAESALRLNNRDEAVAEYKLCLKLDPDGLKAKAAQRALSSLKSN